MQWYYSKNNEARGPVEEDEFRRLSREGIIASGDLVWNESFGSQWRPARSVPEYQTAGQDLPKAMDASLRPEGEGQNAPQPAAGVTPNGQLMADARAALSGKWGLGVGAGVLLYAVLIGIQLVPWIGGILSLLATGPLMIGCYALFLAIIRRASPGIGMLFQGFNRFGSALGLYLLVAVFNLLWCLLAILPGLILTGLLFAGHISLAAVSRGASPFLPGMTPGLVILPFLAIVIPVLVVSTIVQLRYAQAYFILIDQPEGGCLSALRASIGMMRGNKWKLFCLYWRFFGWAVLCLFTCGIGTLWLLPYMMASYARFYEDVRT